MATRSPARWRRYVNRIVAAEISVASRYCDKVLQYLPSEHDTGALLEAIQCPAKVRGDSADSLRDLPETASIVLLNGTLNHSLDIQALLSDLTAVLSRSARIVAVMYNPYFRWLYVLANRLGFRKGALPCTFITRNELRHLSRLSGCEVVRLRPAVYLPWSLLGLGTLLNRVLPTLPGIRWLSLVSVAWLRPVKPDPAPPTLSVIIPARNERGNIEDALRRMPSLGHARLEVIFVEGHSTDGTWDEIQRVLPLYGERFALSALRQTGTGKADAVRLGFSRATGDLVTILDADLTMPPEMLVRFYDAYTRGLGDFVNGSRLVYPMEGEAMRFLNHLGNVLFAKTLSSVMGVPIGDSLCGTKLMAREAYTRMVRWREDFGDFDPFGDFELLFPASEFALGIVDVPVRYRARTYGSTNIRRFRHGWSLLVMAMIGLYRLKLGRTRA
jgi:hypothetical protein